ncbi:dipeptidyl peptidase IV N-terminal region-domain-containing protein [Syncephalis pseudoplumigaleata]|uniref:Dipeptidyl peptidase IV N-terminal region-domain-containing protein n=2 Tax=Syncephalis pseudoplumigaleata TaxID=1712513 RepID=A0A4P9YX84_9FUNG|nr:dipeptidyl peptidase IV N-terminal region-domain-containing protein [Syncephalis pseudoplumigaleata]|eukprot:RKP24465.1 dipeptidyl peptidase IV N-terminal region-domain-containing protein [Syncephalis pseudoplumigaleata]
MLTDHDHQEWRHSSFAEYIIYEVATRKVTRLTETGQRATTSYAKWSPVGHSVMFVRDNDLYVKVDMKLEVRVTYDGSSTIFNGIPDWIYEEEVFTSNFVCWWSPNAQHIAYLRLDETNVPEYNMTMYVEKQPREDSYPTEVKIRYPKPGYPNPIVTLHVYSLASPAPTTKQPVRALEFKKADAFKDEDRLIVEVAWMGNSNLMVRTMNRSQDVAQLYLVDATKLSATFVREERGSVDGGWLEIKQALRYIPAREGAPEGYIDLVVHDDNDHLAYFSSLAADKPAYWLTRGNWEVVDGAAGVDLVDRRVFYISTERGSTERHLYSVSLDGTNKQALTPDDHGFYEAKFSPHAGWYTLSYKGPDIPSQKLYSTRDPKFERELSDFSWLKEAVAKYKLPTIRFSTVKSAGYDLNVKEYLPPDFDPAKKYGVLFRVYGGPASQLVTRAFSPGFDDVIASDPSLQMIVVIVDNRGTGFKGRKFRVAVRKQLGTLETIDQVNAGRAWSKLPYVDPKRIAIWGWSYGGYMAGKVIEANSQVFQAGISVAPVTNWHYYDSIYTERYMLTPQENPDGYEDTGIRDPDGFRHANYLLIHGTGDDNVHFQQSAYLVNMLTESSVDPSHYELQYFTDNNHSMGQHGAYFVIWRRIIAFLHRVLPLQTGSA